MKMTMRYAHLSRAFLSAEVSLLDPPPPPGPKGNGKKTRARKRAKRLFGQSLDFESARFCQGNWLTVLDDFRNWLSCGAAADGDRDRTEDLRDEA